MTPRQILDTLAESPRDRRALEALMALVESIARKTISDDTLRDDIVAEKQVRIWKSAVECAITENLPGYISRVLRNAVITARRQASANDKLVRDYGNELPTTALPTGVHAGDVRKLVEAVRQVEEHVFTVRARKVNREEEWRRDWRQTLEVNAGASVGSFIGGAAPQGAANRLYKAHQRIREAMDRGAEELHLCGALSDEAFHDVQNFLGLLSVEEGVSRILLDASSQAGSHP